MSLKSSHPIDPYLSLGSKNFGILAQKIGTMEAITTLAKKIGPSYSHNISLSNGLPSYFRILELKIN